MHLTVTRRQRVGNGKVTLGEARTLDELHELLRGVVGTVLGTGGAQPVRLDLEAPIGEDRAYVEQIAAAAAGDA